MQIDVRGVDVIDGRTGVGIGDDGCGREAPAHRQAPAAGGKMQPAQEKGFSAVILMQLSRPQGNRQFSSFNTSPSSVICDAVGG